MPSQTGKSGECPVTFRGYFQHAISPSITCHGACSAWPRSVISRHFIMSPVLINPVQDLLKPDVLRFVQLRYRFMIELQTAAPVIRPARLTFA